jgi:hypothetical protein
VKHFGENLIHLYCVAINLDYKGAELLRVQGQSTTNLKVEPNTVRLGLLIYRTQLTVWNIIAYWKKRRCRHLDMRRVPVDFEWWKCLMWHKLHWSTKFHFFFVPRGKISNPDSTFNTEFKYVSSFSPSPTVFFVTARWNVEKSVY